MDGPACGQVMWAGRVIHAVRNPNGWGARHGAGARNGE
jgi:hypothetical protein